MIAHMMALQAAGGLLGGAAWCALLYAFNKPRHTISITPTGNDIMTVRLVNRSPVSASHQYQLTSNLLCLTEKGYAVDGHLGSSRFHVKRPDLTETEFRADCQECRMTTVVYATPAFIGQQTRKEIPWV
jgi:hypothetical protein